MHGIVEGFYGRPYTPEMRRCLIRVLSTLADPVYLHAPKDDPFHRTGWRQSPAAGDWDEMGSTASSAVDAGVRFIYGLSPWLFSDGEHGIAENRLLQAVERGASGVCLLFDDIPDTASAELAVRQLAFAERAVARVSVPVMVCPTVYCGRFLREYPGAQGYLEAWRSRIDPDWEVLWTGTDVVSRELSGLGEAAGLLGRPPVVWDNLLADDYCLRRVYLGSLTGRAVPGVPLLLNPSCIFPVALHGAMELVAALTGERIWPDELGPRLGGWDTLRDFNFTPWSTTGEGARVLAMLRAALEGGDTRESLEWLGNALASLAELACGITGIPGGWELCPHVRDMARSLSIWRKALLEDSPSSRAARLHYLMHVRLPYENPVAASAAHPLEGRA